MTEKELIKIRNKIVKETAIPCLLRSKFLLSPFSTAWNGRNNVNDFDYELCRVTTNSRLEIVEIYVARGDRSIQFNLNIFELTPKIESIEQLRGFDGLQFKLPPNSITEMRLRSDDIQGIPLFRLNYMNGHKLRRSYTKDGLMRSVNRLTETIRTDMVGIDRFVKRWHELHQPLKTNWTGHRTAANSIDK